MDASRQPIVAIDGPAGSGKSTVARLVALRAGLPFISSGAMYRAVALCAMREGVSAADRGRLVQIAAALEFRFVTEPCGVMRTFIDGEDITETLQQPSVAQVASAIATIPPLRAELVAKQQAYGRQGGVVMEGRDIQTVVFPDADIKIFLTASPEERARRRWKELVARGESHLYAAILQEVRERDHRDETRAASPLRAAPDAICIDTDHLGIEQVVEYVLAIIHAWRNDPTLQGESLARAANGFRGQL